MSINRSNNNASPEFLFILGGISQYSGAATAVGLFENIRPGGVALLRVLAAALAIIFFRRSWKRKWNKKDLLWASAFGIVLAAMNLSIYLAIELLPLGNAVAIEFLGPIAVAAIGARTIKSASSLGLASVGVIILAGVQPSGTALGILFALIAGLMWAAYIVLGHQVARHGAAIDGLGVGMLVGAFVIAPFGITEMSTAFSSPNILGLALLTGVLSNVIPYSIDQNVLSRISRSRFAFLQALLPVTASVIGFLFLNQETSWAEMGGISLVIAAILIRSSDHSQLK